MFHFKRKRTLLEKKEVENEHRNQKILHEIKESVSTEKELAEKIYNNQKKQHVMLEELLELAVENEDAKEKANEFNAKEELLVNTIFRYDEYLFQMQRQSANEHDSWNAQLQLVHNDMRRQLALCGIQEIRFEQEKADPSLCQIIETIPTAEQEKDNIVCEMISPGYVYHGKIQKKSKVTIYKFRED